MTDTTAPTTGHQDTRFATQIGGWLTVGPPTPTPNGWTQDFIDHVIVSLSIAGNDQEISFSYGWNLASLGNRVSAAAIWQTYRLNSIEAIFTYIPGASFDQAGQSANRPFSLGIAPYSRNPLQAGNIISSVTAFSIPGCTAKTILYPGQSYRYVSGETQHFGPIGGDPQSIHVVNPCPMYQLDTFNRGSATQQGQTYSNAPVSCFNGSTTDITSWNCFLGSIHMYSAFSGMQSIQLAVLNKVNITFEGVSWRAQLLYPFPTETSRMVGFDDMDTEDASQDPKEGLGDDALEEMVDLCPDRSPMQARQDSSPSLLCSSGQKQGQESVFVVSRGALGPTSSTGATPFQSQRVNPPVSQLLPERTRARVSTRPARVLPHRYQDEKQKHHLKYHGKDPEGRGPRPAKRPCFRLPQLHCNNHKTDAGPSTTATQDMELVHLRGEWSGEDNDSEGDTQRVCVCVCVCVCLQKWSSLHALDQSYSNC